ncbi:MAG TPA: CopG family transcriptional regulator [Thermoanaerobaculia bacterium]|nr:CopG family transcriptional regulator [Thermoanaerobaculia bacterium]
MKRTTITLPDDLSDLVDLEARRRQTSVSEVIRTFILEGLAGTVAKPREIPFAGLFHDPGMVAGETIDEALKLHWADDIDRDRG